MGEILQKLLRIPNDRGQTEMIAGAMAIEELAKLLADEARLDEKIRDTEVALFHIKKQISQSLVQRYVSVVQRYVTVSEEKIEMPEDLMKQEQSYERLLHALQEMKSEIVKQIRPVEEQIVQSSLNHLRQTFEQESHRLGKCLEEIDHKLLDCRKHLEEYDRIRSALHTINEQLSRLAAEPLPVGDQLPTHDLGEIIRSRVEHLRSQGQI
jgi:chromosome segregation ATPase